MSLSERVKEEAHKTDKTDKNKLKTVIFLIWYRYFFYCMFPTCFVYACLYFKSIKIKSGIS